MKAEQFLDKELEVNHPLKIENIAAVSYCMFWYAHSRRPLSCNIVSV